MENSNESAENESGGDESQPKTFRFLYSTGRELTEFALFSSLQEGILRCVLKTMLLLGKPITNPWPLPGPQSNTQSDDDWRTALNVGILRTCKTIRREGLQILYGMNIFRFTREISGHAHLNTSSEVRTFLSRGVFVPDAAGSFNLVPTAKLIKHILLQDSDNERDDYAVQRLGKALVSGAEIQKVDFTLMILRRLVSLQCQLESITIIVDEEVPGLKQHLTDRSDSVGRLLTQSSYQNILDPLERLRRITDWNNFSQGSNETLALTERTQKETPRFVKLLNIRGATSVIEAMHKDEPKALPVARALRRWCFLAGIMPMKIRSSGSFEKRVILPDGTIALPVFVVEEVVKVEDTGVVQSIEGDNENATDNQHEHGSDDQEDNESGTS